MATIEDIRQQVSDYFFRQNPNSAVNGVAVGALPLEGAPAQENPRLGPESVLIFVSPSAARCVINAIHQETQRILERNKSNVPIRLLHAHMPVALQTATGTSVSPSTPFQYNVPPIYPGTFGALVKAGGRDYLLSSNHVVAQNGRVRDRIPVVTPGAIDDPTGGQTLGLRSYFVTMNPPAWGSTGTPTPYNQVDCALAEVTQNVTPAGAIQPASNSPRTVLPGGSVPLGTSVSKTGRTTGHTSSQITKTWDGPIAFSFGIYYFQGLMGTYDVYNPVQQRINIFAAPGDSGSVVLDGSGNGVGLIMARQLVFDPNYNFIAYIILFCSLDLVAQQLINVMNLPPNSQLKFFV